MKHITVRNFHISSKGTFIEIDKIPNGFELIYDSSTGSKYYVNSDKTILVRIANHWGKKIKKCTWHLKGYVPVHSQDWQDVVGLDMKIGMIKFVDLKDNRYQHTTSTYSPRTIPQ
jgi:hypothetical protein